MLDPKHPVQPELSVPPSATMHHDHMEYTHNILFLPIRDSLISQLFDGHKDADSIPDLLDAHFLEDLLVAFEEIIAVEVIG